jgi:F-type H+-transporting ATPase subunit b
LKLKLKSVANPLLTIALILASATLAPARSFAQEAAATQTAPARKAPEPDQVKVKDKSSQSNEEAFTHTALVQSIGKALGLDIDTAAKLFLWINFAIIFFAIVIPVAKVLPKALRNRRETLSKDLEVARKTTADANSRLSAVEAQLSKLDEEIAKIRTQVEDEIKNDEARIKSSIGEETARIVAAAEQEIAVAAAQAQRGVKAFAADLAIDQAVKQLTLTAENDRALIEEFVAQSGEGGAH